MSMKTLVAALFEKRKKKKERKKRKIKREGGGTSFRFERIRKNQGENRDGQVTDNVVLDRYIMLGTYRHKVLYLHTYIYNTYTSSNATHPFKVAIKSEEFNKRFLYTSPTPINLLQNKKFCQMKSKQR